MVCRKRSSDRCETRGYRTGAGASRPVPRSGDAAYKDKQQKQALRKTIHDAPFQPDLREYALRHPRATIFFVFLGFSVSFFLSFLSLGVSKFALAFGVCVCVRGERGLLKGDRVCVTKPRKEVGGGKYKPKGKYERRPLLRRACCNIRRVTRLEGFVSGFCSFPNCAVVGSRVGASLNP